MKDIRFTIISNTKIADKTYKMVLGCEDNGHGVINPGQFVNIRLDGFYLRRPISVCDWNEETLTIIYKTVGRGTEYMSGLKEGEKLDILTPLGNGYDTAKCGQNPILIGGGAGVPPMYGLCKELKKEGKNPTVVLGFNSEKEVFYIDEFKALGADVKIATADGSVGIKGFVTDALKELSGYDHICACGPEPMLKAIDNTADENIEGHFSFEERMGCGFGACMGCSCETKYGNKRICKDGPVLERSEIIW